MRDRDVVGFGIGLLVELTMKDTWPRRFTRSFFLIVRVRSYLVDTGLQCKVW